MNDYVLFKFRTINKHLLKSLVHSEIHFAGPERLNDPFDCRVDIINALQNAISRSQSHVRVRLEQLLSARDFFVALQKNLQTVGVCSFTLELDNPLMWAHYAEEHRGLCLTYSFSESFFYENADHILGVSPVDYGANPLADWFIENAPKFDSFEQFGKSLIKKVLTVKSKPWDYEKEVRIIHIREGSQVLNKLHLKQVCFGLKTDKSDVKLIGEILKNGGYDVTLCKMERNAESDFGLKPIEI